MFAPFLFAIAIFFFWAFWAPNRKFLSAFASLTDRPVISNVWGLLIRREHVGGFYRDRPVVFVIHHRRRKNQAGYFVLAMRARAVPEEGGDGSGSFSEWIAQSPARDAWDELELEYELKLSLDDGWMKATWRPVGFRRFPGRFDEQRWRATLHAIHAVVVALEQRATVVRPAG